MDVGKEVLAGVFVELGSGGQVACPFLLKSSKAPERG